MPQTDGLLRLNTFLDSANNWADGMNQNMVSVDREVTRIHQDSVERALDIETAIAARASEILQLVQQATGDYSTTAASIRDNAVSELKVYIDALMDPHIQVALANQNTIFAALADTQSRLDALETVINEEFNRVEAIVVSLYSNLSTDLDSKLAEVQSMRAQLVDLVNNVAETLSEHVQDTDNPHRITFAQAGGAEAVKYVADPSKDIRYL